LKGVSTDIKLRVKEPLVDKAYGIIPRSTNNESTREKSSKHTLSLGAANLTFKDSETRIHVEKDLKHIEYTTVTKLRGEITRFNYPPSLVQKGWPAVEYKSAGGWTTINNPLSANPSFNPIASRTLLVEGEDDTENSGDDQSGEEGDGVWECNENYERINVQEPENTIVDVDLKSSTKQICSRSLGGLDITAVIKKDGAKFSKCQDNAMRRWILNNKVHLVIHHKVEFEALLDELGFLDDSFSPEVLRVLRTKVRGRLQSLKDAMVRTGDVAELKDNDGKNVLKFAVWTEDWLDDNWDGLYARPTGVVQRAFGNGFVPEFCLDELPYSTAKRT
jgi:hypothetical protein